MSDGDISIAPAEVSSLGDRRRISSLEASIADLQHKLVEAMQRAKPALSVERTGCYHFGTPQVFDREERVVCGDCGAEMNPYEVLRRIAHHEVNFCYRLNALRAEAKALGEEVKRLKATRSRLRRARGNTGGNTSPA